MPVNLPVPVAADLHPVAGVRIGVTEAGVRKANRKDLTVFLLDEGASVAGVFTQNRFCAAPVPGQSRASGGRAGHPCHGHQQSPTAHREAETAKAHRG